MREGRGQKGEVGKEGGGGVEGTHGGGGWGGSGSGPNLKHSRTETMQNASEVKQEGEREVRAGRKSLRERQ